MEPPPALLPAGGPAGAANRARNRRGWDERAHRWRPARDALWGVLDRHVPPGGAVLVAGAGNAHDLPLTRLLARAGRVDLLDVDAHAVQAALRREPASLAAKGRALGEDVTAGAADRVVRAAAAGRVAPPSTPPHEPLGAGGYDVAIGDLVYTQLLYPALVDAAVPAPLLDAAMLAHAQALTDLAVARLHASAPAGAAIHVHDVLGWWRGHQQPATAAELLRLPPSPALRAAAAAHPPRGGDVQGAIPRAGGRISETALWRWPFAAGVEYLVAAFVATSR